jgi:hypothetical protein
MNSSATRTNSTIVARDASGNLFSRDFHASRGDGTGYIYLNEANTRYLYFDGVNYGMPSSDLYINGGKAWHAGNDGSGSTLDADLLDGAEGAAYAKVGSTNTFTIQQLMSTGASPALITLTANTGINKYFILQTGSTPRWAFGSDNNAESGSNVGSNWFLNSYTDAGAAIGTAMSITRATMAASVTATSDESLKTNIEELSDEMCHAFVIEMQGVTYNWKSTGKASIGLIAQAVRKLEEKYGIEGRIVLEDEAGTLSLHYGNMMAFVGGSTRYQEARQNALEARLKALEDIILAAK